jgi:hypothetical protein
MSWPAMARITGVSTSNRVINFDVTFGGARGCWKISQVLLWWDTARRPFQ